jgi:ubiquitin carboxyl-terminal hydrolase 34
VQESERKAYNPRPFCKTYTMDKQPLNTGEQKDMTEFFTDLITKIEEMSHDLVRPHSVPFNVGDAHWTTI